MMKEVHCPGCAAAYTIDVAKMPAGGGILTCPACGERWKVLPVDDKTVELERASTPVAGSATIACPSCGHRFDAPRAGDLRKSVLVVDDQEFFRNFAVDLIADRYRTHVAKSLEEALRKVEQVSPDLIVLDLGLDQGPDDGIRILEELGGRVPVIIMTGRADFDLYGDEWRRLERLGARDFVVKSLSLGDELPQKILAAIGA